MMNFIILFILSWLLGGPWRSPDTFYFQTEKMAEATWLPKFFADSRLHWGFAIAIVAAIAVYVLKWKTPLGFEIRGLGVNEVAAKFKGISVPRTTIVVMLISGALAGLAGRDRSGWHPSPATTRHLDRLRLHRHHYCPDRSAPPGRGGGSGDSVRGPDQRGNVHADQHGTPSALVEVIQGLVLITVLVGAVVVRYRIRRIHHDE